MKLIVGLGNPEERYNSARHNVGFIMLDRIANELGMNFSFDKKINGEIAKDGDMIFLKPHTYMNNSGEAVLKAKSFYKIDDQDIIVIHDELDIPFGKIKFDFERSSAGHNGVESIIHYLKTKNFYRIRIGIKNETLDEIKSRDIDRDKKSSLVGDFVLAPFDEKEKEELNNLSKEVLSLIKSSL